MHTKYVTKLHSSRQIFQYNIGMDSDKYIIPTYNKIADTYAGKYFDDLSDVPYIDTFLTYLKPGAHILDVGCGNGNFSRYIQRKGYTCEGIDLSPEMLRIAKERVPGIPFILKDMKHLDYPDASFDGILAAYSLIHIPSEEIILTLQGFHRVLTSKGVMLIITQKGEPDKIVDEPMKPGEKIFINFFTVKSLISYLKQAGFRIMYQEEMPIQDTTSLSDTVIYTIVRKHQE